MNKMETKIYARAGTHNPSGAKCNADRHRLPSGLIVIREDIRVRELKNSEYVELTGGSLPPLCVHNY